jgi:hypothetical protein
MKLRRKLLILTSNKSRLEKKIKEAQSRELKRAREEKEKEKIKAELTAMGIYFNANTGLKKLKEKLKEAKAKIKSEEL